MKASTLVMCCAMLLVPSTDSVPFGLFDLFKRFTGAGSGSAGNIQGRTAPLNAPLNAPVPLHGAANDSAPTLNTTASNINDNNATITVSNTSSVLRPTAKKIDTGDNSKVGSFQFFGGLVQSFLSTAFGNTAENVGRSNAPPNSPAGAKTKVISRDQGFQVSCSTCGLVVNLMQSYVRNGRSPEDIATTAISVCITFKIESEIVCRGAVSSLVHHIVHIIKHSTLKEVDACGFILGGDCEDSSFENTFNWTVPLPESQKRAATNLIPPKNGFPIKRILHLSDTHLDPFYKEGANAECGAPLCCRESLGMATDPSLQAGHWGDYRDCDSPRRTIEHMLENIAKTQSVDYVFWTGDLPPHDVYNQTRTSNLNIIKELMELLSKYFPNTPIFPALGNHEAEPVNCFPPPEVTGEFSISWLYNELSQSWPKLVQRDVSATTVAKGAYYSVLVEPGFRIIALNMNYCNNKNWWLLINSTDPADELKWLTSELEQAEIKEEKVYILGHIPPGHEDCTKVWSRNYHKIVNRFESTIVAQFYGHTHYDELMIFYDDDNLNRATSIAYIGASTTPYSNMNPAYKVYTADGSYPGTTRMILDGETYYMNLTEANVVGEPHWNKLYSYKDAYGMESLTPQDWSNFIRKLPADEALFRKFLKHMHRDSDSFPACDARCAQEMICQQVSSKTADHSVCKLMGITASTDKLRRPGVISK